MQIMTTKTTTIRTIYIHAVLTGVILRQISYDIVSYALSTCQVFLKYCLQLPQNII